MAVYVALHHQSCNSGSLTILKSRQSNERNLEGNGNFEMKGTMMRLNLVYNHQELVYARTAMLL